MSTISIVEFRKDLAEVLNQVAYGGQRVVLHRRGKKAAALVSMDDLALLEKLEDESDVRAARRALKEKSSASLQTIKADLRMPTMTTRKRK